MLYDQFFIDDLKERADIVRIIEPYVQLKKRGSNWTGPCPFHQEKTPSFSVNQAKGIYKCFGCGKGGNVYTFLMEIEGLNFPEAIQRVAEINGIPLPQPVDDDLYKQKQKEKKKQKDLADQVIELNRLAMRFWQDELNKDNSNAAFARDYLTKRGITEIVQKQFRLGYSPDSWDALLNHLKENNVDAGLIEVSGLVSKNEEKDRVYDRFRNRVMFPVLDVNGDPVAFGARTLGDEPAKYLNSPETPAYIKSRHLYGLFQAKEAIREKKFTILVEGYLDLIALHQFGIKNAAASLGTAFTSEQSRLLSRFTKKVVINYDGDDAGVKAARRAIEELLPNDFEIKVLVLPGGKDPDDFIRENGVEEYVKARGGAMSFLDFIQQTATAGRSMSNAKHKADAIESVLPTLAAIKNPIQQRQSFDETMAFFHFDDDTIKRSLWTTVKNSSKGETEAIKQQVRTSVRSKITVAERKLLELMVYDMELRERVFSILEETDFENLATAPIYRFLSDNLNGSNTFTLENVSGYVGDDPFFEDLVPLLVMTEPKREDGEAIDEVFHEAEDHILALRRMAIDERISNISQQLLASERSGNPEAVQQLVEEQLDLSRMKQTLLKQISEI